ncbi:MAG: hypothetical protein CSB49_08450 [Proteobacteria bacterium]|nr:MAG: hypothetical protein CSB49_08450 [Pseudomonadota bacterium]
MVAFVLGSNLWASLLLVPLYHQRTEAITLPSVLAAPPLLLLLVGVLLRSRLLLLGLFPLSLLAPVLTQPSLLGVDVLSPLAFTLVGVAAVSFSIGASMFLARATSPVTPLRGRDLEDTTAGKPKWRSRRLLYFSLTALAVAIPWVLIHALYLRPEAFNELRQFYPQRAGAAAALFGVLVLALWLLVFLLYFARPLREHIRGTSAIHAQLERLRSDTMRHRPRPRFYVAVGAALLLMVVFCLYL